VEGVDHRPVARLEGEVMATGGFALRGLVWVGGGYRWYANDGLAAQPIHSHC
jgi:hypothetical protein